MTQFPFRPDVKLTDFLKQHTFTLSAEVIPPRNGAEQAQVLTQIQALAQSGSQFIAVTKGAGGSLRGGSLPIAQAIKDAFGLPCIAHFTCRDLTPFDVENQLMDHHYFGIRNILALRGDPPDGASEWKPREGGYSYAYELIAQIRKMNQGEYLSRPGGPTVSAREKTDFCIGAAVYPEHPDLEERVEYFRRKVEAGAEYGITDLLFDADAYSQFLDLCAKRGLRNIPVLPGTRVLRSQAQADRIMKKFRVRLPREYYQALPEKDGPGALEKGIELTLELVEKLKRAGAPGIHLFVIVETEGSRRVLETLRTV